MKGFDFGIIATEYAERRRANPAVLAALTSRRALSPETKVLEVGCGSGNYIANLPEISQSQCWGIDPSTAMLRAAKSLPSPVYYSEGRAENLAFPSEFFDFVFSVDVIHHIEDRASYFGEACRVLKPGGLLCTVTDSDWIIRHREPMSVYFPETVEVEFKRYPPISVLREELTAAGFSIMAEETVEYPYLLSDAGLYVEKTFSTLHLIPEAAYRRGLRKLQADLAKGPVPCVSRYLLLWGSKE